MDKLNMAYYEELKKAMDMCSSIQEMYKLYINAMGLYSAPNILTSGNINVPLDNKIVSTMEFSYDNTCNVSTNI